MRTDLTKEQCEQILAQGYYAHLGCIDGDEPYVLPITYVYRDGFIWSYTREGQKVDAMRRHPRVCVQVENVRSGAEWESVICWGQFEEVTDEKSKKEVRLMLADEHGKMIEEGKPLVSPMVKHLHEERSGEPDDTVIYRIRPDRMTGKAEKR